VQLNPEGLAASRILRERQGAIADTVTRSYFEARPELAERRAGARRKCTEDTRYHIAYLCEAISFGQPTLFTEYIAWAAAVLARLNIPGEALAFHLTLLRDTLASQTDLAAQLDGAGAALAAEYFNKAITKIEGSATELSSYLEGTEPFDVMARDYLAALLTGERRVASNMIMTAVERGAPIHDIYLLVFQRVLHEIGRLWQCNRISVAQEHYCTACTQTIMSQLYPYIFSGKRNGHRLVGTCVGGDLHEIGVRMVADFFEMAGWDTFYLGANVPIAGILQQVAERTPHVLAVSATLSSHLQAVADLIAAARATENPPRILVGGRPFNSLPDLWRDVGADGCGRDAAEAIVIAERWVG
jgi:methanogenic corrinoid protein MtbC1